MSLRDFDPLEVTYYTPIDYDVAVGVIEQLLIFIRTLNWTCISSRRYLILPGTRMSFSLAVESLLSEHDAYWLP